MDWTGVPGTPEWMFPGNGVNGMNGIEVEKQRGDYTWLIALGVMYLGFMILLSGPHGLMYNALRGLMTGLALCCVFLYMVLSFLPDKYR